MTTSSAQQANRRGVVQSLTGLSVRYVERLMPDPYLFAVILTLIVAAWSPCWYAEHRPTAW